MSGPSTTTLVPEAGPAARSPRWVRLLLLAGALAAAVLVGGTGGLLLADHPRAAGPRPNAVDVGFAQDMTVHHRQAVTMAGWARDHSDDPAIRQLAFDIELGQTEQIGRMQGWLGLWSRAAMPPDEPMRWMRHDDYARHAAPGRTMPGMATPAELDRLRSLSGPELDVYFLQLMIRHHQGGVPMLHAATGGAALGEVRNLAQQMLTAQTAETRAMTAMLTERDATPLPPPG
ncbi:Uncharacterized conserved protein, DUF305 family [Amycolatopsis arida]|uniref:Uncharacterized conserved protein, DUF305 family n=1 Tax=Amycolatopsis arida TaxID=587909 RepID=A0A1I6ALL3_9PSEU|nr:DUF305 domain-containing protein [Amycolatopsis arida]TDX87384.1 uncharacterized protein (DUF305 family) [Amycolatopsis arida]SFQ69611.1 Uncharacterized conserved protein, DUF305 family [Amycolatopsis arida]